MFWAFLGLGGLVAPGEFFGMIGRISLSFSVAFLRCSVDATDTVRASKALLTAREDKLPRRIPYKSLWHC
jgi:hypothetical protein